MSIHRRSADISAHSLEDISFFRSSIHRRFSILERILVEYVSFDTMYVYVMNDLSRLQSRSRMRKDGNFEIPTLGSSNKPDNGEGREKQSVSLQGNFCGNQSSTVVRPRGAREGNDLADLLNVFNDTSKEGRSLSVLVRCPRRSPLSYEQSTANRSLWSIYVRVIKTRNRRG